MEIDQSTLKEEARLEEWRKLADDKPGDALPFYEAEGRLLSLWDQLNELNIELALLESQAHSPPEVDKDNLKPDAGIAELEQDCLEARNAYELKQNAVRDTLVAMPTLAAAHAVDGLTATEAKLSPLIARRDVLALASANLSSELLEIKSSTTAIEAADLKAGDHNRFLSASISALSSEIEQWKQEVRGTERFKPRLIEVNEEAQTARERHRIMKNTVSAVVAASGVDWARDPELLNLVMDDDDAEEDEA